jgi:GNAT superfamily N-acetyltransferase
MPSSSLRIAEMNDADSIARLVNLAFLVERPFIKGDRITAAHVRQLLAKGAFLLAVDGGVVVGCVYVELQGERGYLGLLAVDPARQKTGLGSSLVTAAEKHCQAEGCSTVYLTVVSRRSELLVFYRRLGYAEGGTAPFPEPARMLVPVHLIEMSKPLRNPD